MNLLGMINMIANYFFYIKPNENWNTTIIHKNNTGFLEIIKDNTSPFFNEKSLIFKARYNLFKTSNRGIPSWKNDIPYIF